MKKILQYLFEHKTLPRDEAKQIMLSLAKGVYNDSELAAFITVYLMRTITIDELQGFREGLLELALPVPLAAYKPIDIVGTGGDGKNTFNISTLACFVAAGAGAKVAKHGNYGASSISGASNVMETLGYRFRNDAGQLERELAETGFTFLHAPLFHPALKAVAGIRRSLGFRTFFNMLGPLVNPARPAYQLVGVYSLEMARLYTYLLQQEELPFTIIHSLDGYDEVSLTNDTKVITAAGEQVLPAVALGKRTVLPADISGGGTVEEAARIFLRILKGEGTWAQNAVVLANAALSLHGSGVCASYTDAYDAAVESLESGRALQTFNKLISLQ
ncbi:anthranilate phosphoribosyltransferase [Flaviaesturariibacter flavus]|uniref:Anthranilate phosphoribosyltransferase n=1 Tax=Flaviaesturariibacter flavus TaxID=2502780 RepID=A0A4R1BA13_9BACT|nr:anthranilate phosphoribosyltransferase [Flaviaesturariibacter flavus]TCJ13754.1 anthranilate phosphoribosyltransferase [Flaviaesturariibacter flavus]